MIINFKRKEAFMKKILLLIPIAFLVSCAQGTVGNEQLRLLQDGLTDAESRLDAIEKKMAERPAGVSAVELDAATGKAEQAASNAEDSAKRAEAAAARAEAAADKAERASKKSVRAFEKRLVK